MKIINMVRVGITPPQPLFFFSLIFCFISLCYYYYYYVFLKKRLCLWDSNSKHVYDFHEQEDIKLLKIGRNQNQTARGFPVLGHISSIYWHNVLPNYTYQFSFVLYRQWIWSCAMIIFVFLIFQTNIIMAQDHIHCLYNTKENW